MDALVPAANESGRSDHPPAPPPPQRQNAWHAACVVLDMKQVYSARDEMDAEMVKNALADAGIEAVVQSGPLSNVMGAIPVSAETLPSVWVRDEDADTATGAVEGFQHPPAPQGEPW